MLRVVAGKLRQPFQQCFIIKAIHRRIYFFYLSFLFRCIFMLHNPFHMPLRIAQHTSIADWVLGYAGQQRRAMFRRLRDQRFQRLFFQNRHVARQYQCFTPVARKIRLCHLHGMPCALLLFLLHHFGLLFHKRLHLLLAMAHYHDRFTALRANIQYPLHHFYAAYLMQHLRDAAFHSLAFACRKDHRFYRFHGRSSFPIFIKSNALVFCVFMPLFFASFYCMKTRNALSSFRSFSLLFSFLLYSGFPRTPSDRVKNSFFFPKIVLTSSFNGCNFTSGKTKVFTAARYGLLHTVA